MTELVELYFDQLNVYFPLLHRPTFERGIRNGLHIADQGFGSVLLCVCALGARFSTHARVILPGTNSWHSAGWQWFKQVQESHRVINLNPPTLYDLQVASVSTKFMFNEINLNLSFAGQLSAAYVNGSSIPHTSFAAIGHGLRLAQDMGAHRRATYPSPPTVESELRKRAFWRVQMLLHFFSPPNCFIGLWWPSTAVCAPSLVGLVASKKKSESTANMIVKFLICL